MTSGKRDANWSADPKDRILQPALSLIVIDKPVNTDSRGRGEGGIKSVRINGVLVCRSCYLNQTVHPFEQNTKRIKQDIISIVKLNIS